jgi:hypothetical protein
MDRLVAPLTVQESWVLCPWLMADGVALNAAITGGAVTVTVVWAVTLPAPFVAVSV